MESGSLLGGPRLSEYAGMAHLERPAFAIVWFDALLCA
jgi:hypothetical protein